MGGLGLNPTDDFPKFYESGLDQICFFQSKIELRLKIFTFCSSLLRISFYIMHDRLFHLMSTVFSVLESRFITLCHYVGIPFIRLVLVGTAPVWRLCPIALVSQPISQHSPTPGTSAPIERICFIKNDMGSDTHTAHCRGIIIRQIWIMNAWTLFCFLVKGIFSLFLGVLTIGIQNSWVGDYSKY